MIHDVRLSKSAKKGLRRVPKHVQIKLWDWVNSVERFGLESVRKAPGWHDENLVGRRLGQRSIRLSRAYRAIYKIHEKVEVVVLEVNKHDY